MGRAVRNPLPHSSSIDRCPSFSLTRSILRIHKEEPSAKDGIYFADRSPFSALFYARNGHLMETNIKYDASLLRLRASPDHLL